MQYREKSYCIRGQFFTVNDPQGEYRLSLALLKRCYSIFCRSSILFNHLNCPIVIGFDGQTDVYLDQKTAIFLCPNAFSLVRETLNLFIIFLNPILAEFISGCKRFRLILRLFLPVWWEIALIFLTFTFHESVKKAVSCFAAGLPIILAFLTNFACKRKSAFKRKCRGESPYQRNRIQLWNPLFRPIQAPMWQRLAPCTKYKFKPAQGARGSQYLSTFRHSFAQYDRSLTPCYSSHLGVNGVSFPFLSCRYIWVFKNKA